MMAKTRTVGIYLFDEAEVLDFAGPFEVFSTASRLNMELILITLILFQYSLLPTECER